MKARIYITLKNGVLDPQGQAVEKTLHRLGYQEAHNLRIGKYVELELGGNIEQARGRVDEMCRKLIANTVIEDYRIEFDGEKS